MFSLVLLVALVVVQGGFVQAADYDVDVLVIGAGGAGLTAAYAANPSEVDVMVIEKMAFPGGASIMASGPIAAANSRFHEELGVEAPWTGFRDYIVDGAVFPYDLDLVATQAKNSSRVIDLVMDLGFEFRPETFDTVYEFRAVDSTYGAIIGMLLDEITKQGGTILLNTRATELLVDDNGAIVGVVASQNNQDIVISAKAVVIATGDSAGNPDLLPQEFRNGLNSGPVSSTGDGIVLATNIGAATRDLDQLVWWGNLVEDGPGLGAYSRGRVLCELGGIYVNSEGKRVSKDILTDNEIANLILEQEQAGKEMWVLFNGNLKEALHENGFPTLVATWSPDRDATEIAKGEQVVVADTLNELAAKMGVPAAVLTETVGNYNGMVAKGEDPDFGRTIFIHSIDEGPYYAMRQRVGIYPVIGGLQIDTQAHVLHENGAPISGLFAAGDVVGGVSADGRETLVPALVFGMIAGETAAAGLAK